MTDIMDLVSLIESSIYTLLNITAIVILKTAETCFRYVSMLGLVEYCVKLN